MDVQIYVCKRDVHCFLAIVTDDSKLFTDAGFGENAVPRRGSFAKMNGSQYVITIGAGEEKRSDGTWIHGFDHALLTQTGCEDDMQIFFPRSNDNIHQLNDLGDQAAFAVGLLNAYNCYSENSKNTGTCVPYLYNVTNCISFTISLMRATLCKLQVPEVEKKLQAYIGACNSVGHWIGTRIRINYSLFDGPCFDFWIYQDMFIDIGCGVDPYYDTIMLKPTSGIIFYGIQNYGGLPSRPIGRGRYCLSALNALGFHNDWANSAQLPSGWSVTVYEHDNFQGRQWFMNQNDTNSRDFFRLGCPKMISSIVVW